MEFNKILIISLILLHQHAIAEISTDGSVGSAQTLIANDGQFSIGQELGSLRGSNLFHSFQQFNLASGESATFTGNDSIQNVISRVTGGNQSIINGILRSQVGSADFYFINPAGVTFSENAQVDVPAAFHVSSAGELIFADGSSFSAINPEASTLTVAEPEGFGFVSGQTGGLQIIGGQLAFKPGTDVSLSANSLLIAGVEQNNGEMQQAKISVEQADPSIELGIHLNLTAVDSATTQTIPITGLADTATGGELSINTSNIDVSGNGSGRLGIRAGVMTAHNSSLLADNIGIQSMDAEDGVNVYVDSLLLNNTALANNVRSQGNAGTVSVAVNGALQLLDEGRISSNTFSNGNAGNVNITARQLMIDGLQGGSIYTGIASGAGPDSDGNAGMVTVAVNETLQLSNGGIINSDTFGTGDAGTINVIVNDALQLLDEGRISTNTFSTGNAGNVDITARQLMIDGVQGSSIYTGIASGAGPDSDGNAGMVTVAVNETLQLSNGGIINSGTFGTGDAGTIIVTVNEALQLLDEGRISTNTSSTGEAGNIDITARQLIIDGLGGSIYTGISSAAEPGSDGNAGMITVAANEILQVVNGGRINSDTFGAGDAGTIIVTVNGVLQLLDEGRISTNTSSTGEAGNIDITARQLIIDGLGSNIFTGISSYALIDSNALDDSNTLADSNAGTVNIDIGNTVEVLNNGQISTSSVNGRGGDIYINSGKLVQLQNATIKTSVEGDVSEKAGNITITVPVLVLNNAKILASTLTTETTGGDVDITATQLIASGNDFNSEDNVIKAADSGILNITSPELNIVGVLANVEIPSLDIERIGQDPCSRSRENSLRNLGHGGTPAFQHEENYIRINRANDSDPNSNIQQNDLTTSQANSLANQTEYTITLSECSKEQHSLLNLQQDAH